MQPIEGLTPEILWYTLVGLAGLGALVILGDKVADVFRRRKARKALEATPSDLLAESVSKKVLESLEPRFAEIDRKLSHDKVLLDDHVRQLAQQETRMGGTAEGQKVLCRGLLALLSHEINGNSDDKLKASQAEITDYLIDK